MARCSIRTAVLFRRSAEMLSYRGSHFFDFFVVMAKRLFGFFSGTVQTLAGDEVQICILVCLGAAAALLGTFFFLKKSLMVINSISHTVLFGISITAVIIRIVLGRTIEIDAMLTLTEMMLASLCTATLTLWLIRFFVKKLRMQEDAGIGFVFTFLFALGLVLITLIARNTHIGTEVIMGNLDLVHPHDIAVCALTFAAALSFVAFFYIPLTTRAFDAGFAGVARTDFAFQEFLLTLVSGFIVVIGFRVVGVGALLGLFVLPPMIARRFTSSVKTMLGAAVMISTATSICAVALSRHILSAYHTALSTSGMLVTLQALVFLFSLAPSRKEGKEKSIA